MCEAHQHGSTPESSEGAHSEHEHGSHDHGSHDHGSHDHAAHEHGHQHVAATTGAETAECPVMKGSYVSKADASAQGLVREYNGEQYYLCCAACGPLFDADPERYLVAA